MTSPISNDKNLTPHPDQGRVAERKDATARPRSDQPNPSLADPEPEVARGQQLLAAERSTATGGTPIESSDQARAALERLRGLIGTNPEGLLAAQGGNLGDRLAMLLQNAPA